MDYFFLIWCTFLHMVIMQNVLGHIIYVNKTVTWDEARSQCAYQYNGKLASVGDDKSRSDLEFCLSLNTLVWTGKYSMVSPWLEIKGCYLISYEQYYILEYPSVYQCYKQCYPSRSIAIKNRLCVCSEYYDFIHSAIMEINHCNITCDNTAYCGGKYGFTVYWKSGELVSPFDHLCQTSTCNSENVIYEPHNCKRNHSYICGVQNLTKYNIELDWIMAMENCMFKNASYLSSNMVCDPQTFGGKQYWIGRFRSEIIMQDKGLDCYDSVTDYQGYINTSTDGRSCAVWENVADSVYRPNNNYCRNLNHERQSPWCYVCDVDDTCYQRICNVTKCDVPYKVYAVRTPAEAPLELVQLEYNTQSMSPYICETADNVNIGADDILCETNTDPNDPSPADPDVTSLDDKATVGRRNSQENIPFEQNNQRTTVSYKIHEQSNVVDGANIGIVVGVAIVFVILVTSLGIVIRRRTKRSVRRKSKKNGKETKIVSSSGILHEENRADVYQNNSPNRGRDISNDSVYSIIEMVSDYETNHGFVKEIGKKEAQNGYFILEPNVNYPSAVARHPSPVLPHINPNDDIYLKPSDTEYSNSTKQNNCDKLVGETSQPLNVLYEEIKLNVPDTQFNHFQPNTRKHVVLSTACDSDQNVYMQTEANEYDHLHKSSVRHVTFSVANSNDEMDDDIYTRPTANVYNHLHETEKKLNITSFDSVYTCMKDVLQQANNE